MRIFALLAFVFSLTMAPVNDAEARRLGGLKSFGKRQNTHMTQPKKQTATPTGASANSGGRKGLMGGMLGGLLAGSLLGALFFGGAFEGIEMMDILIFGGIAFLLFKLLKGKATNNLMQRQATAGNPPFEAPHIASGSTESRPTSSIPFSLPSGFDKESFLNTARSHFNELQEAWNDYDMDKVREFCSPALYAQLAAQRAENTGREHTQVEFLEAEIVRADSNAHLAEISVLYTGRSTDTADGSQDDINEAWHLERDLRQADSPWLIVGIQQREGE